MSSTVASPDIQVDSFTGLVWSAYAASDSGTTIDAPTVLSVPKDHLAVAAQKYGGNLRAGGFYAYEYDGIGNRTKKTARSNYGGGASYTHNVLNQIVTRSTPGVIHVSGYADDDQTVLVNDRPTIRDGEHYFGVVEVNDASAAVTKTVTISVTEHTSEGDITVETSLLVNLPKASETASDITYDSRGNLLTDSVYTYIWDVKNRLNSFQTASGITDDDVMVRLELCDSHRRG